MEDKKLFDIALTYIGTPHINGGNVKGAGLDCCSLITHMVKESCGVDVPIVFGYSMDWFCKKECEELLKPYLDKYCFKVTELKAGDILSFRWGRAEYAHLAMYIGDGFVIHCQADMGVEITEVDSPYFFDAKGNSRLSGYWRLKDEFIQS